MERSLGDIERVQGSSVSKGKQTKKSSFMAKSIGNDPSEAKFQLFCGLLSLNVREKVIRLMVRKEQKRIESQKNNS